MKIKTITDQEILDLILAGRIKIKRLNKRSPAIYKDGKLLKPSLVNSGRCSNLPRYRIEICLPRKSKRHRRARKRTIIRAKLIWMFKEKRILPLGDQVHHRDENRLNDRAKNLVNWSAFDHANHHNGAPF